MAGIVVVGAGQAGAALVAALRARGHDGPLTLIGEEPVPPYQRPPLSKGYLIGALARDRLFLRPESFYADQGIALQTGCRVTGIDPLARRVWLGNDSLPYDQLALTTGAAPRHLPEALGGGLRGVHVMRTLADADALRPGLQAGRRMLVVGGGYIGLEAAAVAATHGLRVTLLEAAPRILQRVAAAETSAFFRRLHRGHGVDVREGVGLERLLGDDRGRVCGARLSDGTESAADLVVVGIGVSPDTALAGAAGLALYNGIAVDAQGRTSVPGIWAAGDCASFPWRGARIRLESVQNAIDQAEAVAAGMLGAPLAYDPVPWFWSDQYDVKLQIAGLGAGHDMVVVRPGAGAGAGAASGTQPVSHWYFAGSRLLAVDAMNDPRAFMIGKRLLEAARPVTPAQVGDPATDLKALLQAG